MSQSYINVIGAGLAGSEAAYQIAERGIPVKLYEMRGVKSTPQHKTDNFAELVCSNSLRGDAPVFLQVVLSRWTVTVFLKWLLKRLPTIP